MGQGDWLQAARLYEESLAVYRRLGNSWGMGISLGSLGEVTLAQGKWKRAATLYRECLTLMQSTGSQWYIALALVGMTGALLGQGQAERAGASHLNYPRHRQPAEVEKRKGSKSAAMSGWAASHIGKATPYWYNLCPCLDPSFQSKPVVKPHDYLGLSFSSPSNTILPSLTIVKPSVF